MIVVRKHPYIPPPKNPYLGIKKEVNDLTARAATDPKIWTQSRRYARKSRTTYLRCLPSYGLHKSQTLTCSGYFP
jgi:hypothetical protein